MRKSFVLSILSVPLIALAGPAQAQKEITVNSFRSASLWPIWAAGNQKMFEKHGLTVKNVYTPNSTVQMIGLIKGEFDMVTTALDNVIAYALGDGNPKAPKDADLIAFLGGNNGALSLVGQKGVKSINELKGRELAVDSTSTGFAFVLREMLAKNGLGPNDYKFVAFGNTGARWEALRDNKAAAGLLTPPLSQVAIAQGFPNLGDAADVLGGYQGIVAGARRDWAKKNADTVVAFIRAYREGLAWLQAPANKTAAIAVLRAEVPETTEAAAERNYQILVADPRGFDPGGKLDSAGAKTVLDLRRRYGPAGRSAELSRFVDESYFERAAKP